MFILVNCPRGTSLLFWGEGSQITVSGSSQGHSRHLKHHPQRSSSTERYHRCPQRLRMGWISWSRWGQRLPVPSGNAIDSPVPAQKDCGVSSPCPSLKIHGLKCFFFYPFFFLGPHRKLKCQWTKGIYKSQSSMIYTTQADLRICLF